ncbi:hypothetical protein F8O04_00070 [Pseudoclavibacter endophyticus]|uniref:Uncharacterized protein n=1 Tax=Pseudoclavibacter endophyticus TaxID=1778590 RepID=A0A6H9WIX1_9MICO|nr:hypothetical protein F8O04_00070 [Pseudoclavibacter endophyticus]
MIEYVTTGRPSAAARLRRVPRPGREPLWARFASATQPGQITPTGAGVWQSPQIVLPQRWHRTKLCRSGCR